jgi:hypothetical protein
MVLGVIVCLVLGGTAVLAQTKTAKQAENLAKAGDSAKKAINDVVTQLGDMLEGYNSIIDGTAGDPQTAYKKLAGDLKSTEKKLQGAQKSAASLDKEVQRFFGSWEKDLAKFSSDDMRQKSQARLEKSKADYAELGTALGQARDEFAPLVQNLNDQILYLGRDLSAEAIADLQDEAAALNRQAQEVTDKVNALISADTPEVEDVQAEPAAGV